MAETGILTGQYVRIELPTASPGDRMVAQLIDWFVQLAYLVLLFFIDEEANGLPQRVLFILLAPIFLYPLLCEVLNHGQSFGKWVRGLRVVMRDGATPTLSAYLLRWLFIIVDGPMMAYMGLLVIALTRNHQRIGDLVAGTVVVKLNTYSRMKVSLDEFEQFSADYRPRYAAAAELSLEQANTISRTLQSFHDERIGQISQKVQQLLGVKKQEPHDYDFLRRIERDYQYYALEEV